MNKYEDGSLGDTQTNKEAQQLFYPLNEVAAWPPVHPPPFEMVPVR
jgi:hypothetical protein